MGGRKPGQSSGRDGGTSPEVGPRGGQRPNFTTVPNNRPMPPTSKPNSKWGPVRTTPDS